MQLSSESGFLVSINKLGDYNETVRVNVGDTFRSAFEKAGLAYEDWTIWGVAYEPNATFDETDAGGTLVVNTKQVKQG